MSKSTDTHNVQLTNLEIFVLEYILEDLDVDLELILKVGKKNILFRYYWRLRAEIKGGGRWIV